MRKMLRACSEREDFSLFSNFKTKKRRTPDFQKDVPHSPQRPLTSRRSVNALKATETLLDQALVMKNSKPIMKDSIPKRKAADLDQMKQMKFFFHGKRQAVFRMLPEAKFCTLKPTISRGVLSNIGPALAAANAEGLGVFMAINTVDGNNAVDAAVTKINALWIDADGTMDLSAIESLCPHLVVQTSPGRFHAYWRVSGLSSDEFKPVMRALARRFGTDPSVCNPGRVMRLAGTVHRKGKPVLAEIVSCDESAEPEPYLQVLDRLDVTTEQKGDQSIHTMHDASVSVADIKKALSFIPSPDDRPTWLKLGMSIHSAWPDEEGFELWSHHSKKSPKYEKDEQRRTWDSFGTEGGVTIASLFWIAEKYEWKRDRADTLLPVDDFELLDEFGRIAKGTFKFDVSTNQWLTFRQPAWENDEAQVVQGVRVLLQPMTARAKNERAAATLALLKRYQSIGGLRLLLRDATAVPELVARTHEFDTKHDLLAVKNGVVELRTGTFREGRPEDMLRAVAPTVYDKSATCPKFLKFIDFFTCGREEYAAFLQRALGYTLFGHTNEQVFFVLLGGGGNGKGTLFRVITFVLGKALVKPIPANLITRAYAGSANGPSDAIMALNGPRMVICGEGEGGRSLDGAFIKQLSGSDAFSARGSYGHQTEFTPTCKLWLAMNDLPEVPHDDEAIWRRLLVLPCEAEIESRDGSYEEQLHAEAAGILNWLIEGAREYSKQRLGSSTVVSSATLRGRLQFDSVRSWLADRCVIERDATVRAGAAFEDYRTYCKRQGRTHLSPQKFPSVLKAKGYSHRERRMSNVYEGFRLRVG